MNELSILSTLRIKARASDPLAAPPPDFEAPCSPRKIREKVDRPSSCIYALLATGCPH